MGERVEQEPEPFIWTKTADEILDTLAAYYQRINDSGSVISIFGVPSGAEPEALAPASSAARAGAWAATQSAQRRPQLTESHRDELAHVEQYTITMVEGSRLWAEPLSGERLG
jgi:hypothetical protein